MKTLKEEKSLLTIGPSWIHVSKLSDYEYNRAMSNIQELWPLVIDKLSKDDDPYFRFIADELLNPEDETYSFEDLEIHIGIQVYFDEEK